jgi:hypothetical protein
LKRWKNRGADHEPIHPKIIGYNHLFDPAFSGSQTVVPEPQSAQETVYPEFFETGA